MSNKIPDSEMLPKSSAVSKAFTDETHKYLLSLLTNPGRYKAASDLFHASYNAVMEGDTEQIGPCEEHRKNLDREHALLLGLAKLAALQDPSIPEKLGLGQLGVKTVAVATAIPKPSNFRLAHSMNNGEMTGSVSSIKGVRMFEIWGCEGDPNLEQNWRLMAASPNCQRIAIKGLTPGTKYWFRVRAVRGNETGPWSNYITLMAI